MERPKIRTRERDAIVRALTAGVVPRVGLQHIQVGRSREIEELLRDMDRIAEGGTTIRFIIGEYGSGKTFFPEPGQTDSHGKADGRAVGRHFPGPPAPRHGRTGPFPLCRDGPEYIHSQQAGRRGNALGGGALCH